MGRAKLKMELITKEKTRYSTYQKRKAGILKKANEFSILCDVDTLIIIYPPNSKEPEVWPENPEKITKTIASYKSKKGESGRKTCDLNDFFQDRSKRIEEELKKARKKNMEAKYATWFDELNGLNEVQLRQFAGMLENRECLVKAIIDKKTAMVRKYNGTGCLSSHPNNLNHVQVQPMNMTQFANYDQGWFNDSIATSSSFVPMKYEPMGYVYNPMYEGGVVCNDMNHWGYQPGLGAEFSMPENVSHVSNGVDMFAINDPRRF